MKRRRRLKIHFENKKLNTKRYLLQKEKNAETTLLHSHDETSNTQHDCLPGHLRGCKIQSGSITRPLKVGIYQSLIFQNVIYR